MRISVFSLILPLAAASAAAGADDTVYIVRGSSRPPAVVPVGTVLRFVRSDLAGIEVTASATDGAKVVRTARFTHVTDGRPIASGMSDVEIEVKAETAGKAKVRIAVKSDGVTISTEYDITIETPPPPEKKDKKPDEKKDKKPEKN